MSVDFCDECGFNSVVVVDSFVIWCGFWVVCLLWLIDLWVW